MRVPMSWLREYVRTDATTEQIAHALSISTAEINGIERTAQLRHGIPGIRPFWDNDLRFLRQF